MFSIVITEKIATKYFGEYDALNKSIYIDDVLYNITGILRDIPGNSHMKFDYLYSIDAKITRGELES